MVIGVVALIVVGPEKLPATVKTISLWLGRFRRSFNKIKMEVEQQINADEIRRQLHNDSILDEVKNAKNEVDSYIKNAEKKLAELGEEEDENDLFFNTSSNPRAKKIDKQKPEAVKPESIDDLDPGAGNPGDDNSADDPVEKLQASNQNEVAEKKVVGKKVRKKTTLSKNNLEKKTSEAKSLDIAKTDENVLSANSSPVAAMDSKSGVDGGNV